MKVILEYQDFPNENREKAGVEGEQCYICKSKILENNIFFKSHGFYSDKGGWYDMPNFLYITICPECRLKVKHQEIDINI